MTPDELFERLQKLSSHVKENYDESLERNEASTRSMLVDPFLNAMGYDTSSNEVYPEFEARSADKDGNVDYALMFDGIPQIIIECKRSREKLTAIHDRQLERYFAGIVANQNLEVEKLVAILTNGHQYRVFSDLCEPSNHMDSEPVFEFDITDSVDMDLSETLLPLTRENFSKDEIKDLLKTGLDRSIILQRVAEQFDTAEDGRFVKMFAEGLTDGNMTAAVVDRYRPMVKEAFHAIVEEKSKMRALSENNDQEDLQLFEAWYIAKVMISSWLVGKTPSIGFQSNGKSRTILLENETPICTFSLNRGGNVHCKFVDPAGEVVTVALHEADDVYKLRGVLAESVKRCISKHKTQMSGRNPK